MPIKRFSALLLLCGLSLLLSACASHSIEDYADQTPTLDLQEYFNGELEAWMFLIDDKVMLNRASMSKWGIHLGEVSLSFVKP